jgi:hypothetical protein
VGRSLNQAHDIVSFHEIQLYPLCVHQVPKRETYAHKLLHLLSLHARLELSLLGAGESMSVRKELRKSFGSYAPIHDERSLKDVVYVGMVESLGENMDQEERCLRMVCV